MNTDNEQKSLDGTGASIEQDPGGHPLFPRPETETGPDPRRFDLIRIYRYLPDGSMETCPRVWKGSELRSMEQVVDMYGGGKYRFQATCSTTHRIQAYSEYFYVAEPARKPFHNDTKPPGETAPPPPPPPPPPPQQPALDLTMLIKFMLERESRAAEAQAKMQETLLRIALERPAQPNPFETMRDAMQLMQGMNNNHATAANGPDAVRMLERGIAMGKELAGGDGGAAGDAIPWGGLVEAATIGLGLLKKKNEKEETKAAKPEEKPKSEPQKPESPVPQVATAPKIIIDPTTGLPYTFVSGLGYVRLDPAAVLAQMYNQYQPPPPLPQYPYGYPFGMPNMPMPAPQPYMANAQPVAPPIANIPPMPFAQQYTPAPPAAIPQPTIAPAPPPTAPLAQAAPLPRPVAPPVPPPPPAPPTVRSARLQADAVPAQPAKAPITRKRSQKPAPAQPKQPPTPMHQHQSAAPKVRPPHVPPSPPTMQTSGGAPNVPKDAIDELWDESPGDDFAQVVNDGMNSPMAQKIMQDPRYLALRDSVVKGEMSVADVNEEFVRVLFGSKGGES